MLENCLPVPGLQCHCAFCCEQFTCHCCGNQLYSQVGPHPAIRTETPFGFHPAGVGCHSGSFFLRLICKHRHWWMKPRKQAGVLKELLSDFCPFSPRPAEGGQSSGQFQGRPSEVWSQWQSQHHNQQSGDQHSHPQPSQTEVFQVRRVQWARSPSDNFSLLRWRTVALDDQGASRARSNYLLLCAAVGLHCY